jgi:proteasome activator subunit 4
MPPILLALADTVSDPAYIGASVKKMFSEFRRTHQDTWHAESAKFTEDELYRLNDLLISPSYYV